MALTAFIAHRIYRHSPEGSVSTQLRPDVLPINGKLEELGYEMKTQFIRKGGKNYGRFSGELGEFPFPAWLGDYRAGRMSFTSFSEKSLQQLAQLLEATPSLFDAYVWFVEEQIEAGQHIYIYVVEHEASLYLDAELQLNDSLYLDTANINLAAKINCADWDKGESTTYLTLMRSRSDKDVADAFTQFSGFTDKYDAKAETRTFLEAVEHFTQTLEEPVARHTRTKVVDYCLEQNKAGKPVALSELAESLAEETKGYPAEQFTRFVVSQQPEIKEEFIPHAGQVRSYVRISGRSDSLSMSFASECLGREVEYDAERDLLTIKNIPSTLKKQLLSHLRQQQGNNEP